MSPTSASATQVSTCVLEGKLIHQSVPFVVFPLTFRRRPSCDGDYVPSHLVHRTRAKLIGSRESRRWAGRGVVETRHWTRHYLGVSTAFSADSPPRFVEMAGWGGAETRHQTRHR